jgi:hypothetical protein
MRTRFTMVLLAAALGGCSSSKEGWVLGQWVLLGEDGKPGVCHEFKKDGKFITYTQTECAGNTDALLSGRWEFKDKDKLALQRGNDLRAKMAVVSDRKPEQFTSRGAIIGTLFRVGAGGTAEVLRKLDTQGLIKLKPVPPEWGCRQLGMALNEIKALPIEKEPRMLREKDKSLEYRANKNTGDPKIEKVVYAMQQEAIEWIALHLASEAFNPPGPQERLEGVVGKATDSAATGKGKKRQHIAMWRTYCAQLRDTPNKDIDLTLFATAGEKRGTLYVSEQVISSLWEDLKHMASDPSAQSTEEEEEETETPTKAEPTKAEPTKAEPTKAEPKTPAKADKVAPAPKAVKTKAGKGKTAPPADDDDI